MITPSTNVLRGRRALITGASSGLGADFARELASRGCHLILVARREDLLRSIQSEVTARHGVEVEVIPLDLTGEGAVQHLYDQIKDAGKTVDVLVNNAGFGVYGDFVEIPWERQRDMLELDIVALTHLTRLFVEDMVGRNVGFVLQVSSIGAYSPSPTYATYSAAKSYVLSFGEALSFELRKTGVRCTVLVPGIVNTAFREVAGQETTLYQRLAMTQSPNVVRAGVEGMLKGKGVVVPGLINALTAWSSRFLPDRMRAAVAYRMMTMK